MFNRFSAGSSAVLAASITEAKQAGDPKLNTDHLLLGLLHDPASRASAALGIDLASARRARTALDQQALAAVGIDVADLGELSKALPEEIAARLAARPRIRFSPAAADALRRTVQVASSRKSRSLEPEDLLLGLLGAARPDPAAELLAALGVDPVAVRARLAEAA
jgi:ATP-dependent Clp protease ATP-binding subunit ClpA